jgi:tail tube protein
VPLVTPNNNFLLGIAKQTNEATAATNATYSVPVYAAELDGRYDLNRVEVTDAESQQGDPYKTPSYWQGSGIEFPAFAAPLGAFLQSIWPTDTVTGAGPWTHTFSGLGSTPSWYSLFREFPGAGAKEQRFSKGLGSSIAFAGDGSGGPLRVTYGAMGQTYADLAYTPGTTSALADGWFALQLASASIEADFDTPDVNPSTPITNVRSYQIQVERNLTAEPTADGIAVSNLSIGRVVCSGSLEFLYSSWDAYNATHFGAVAGTSQSATIVYGALALNFKHTVQAGWTFELYVPKVMFRVNPVVPGTDGGPLTQSVALEIAKPASGSPVQPVLVNAVTASYAA